MRKHIQSFILIFVIAILTSCQGGNTHVSTEESDTLSLQYAQHLTMVKHEGYMEVLLANPWKQGALLHRYLLVPKGKDGDAVVANLQKQSEGQLHTDLVRTPVAKSVVFTSPHCQLMYEMGCQQAISGVCDLSYINIPAIQQRALSKKPGEKVLDCGSSMQPMIERIIQLKPEALLISPFENSGGYGKLDKMKVPIIETADYMETSPLGRAEWMKFYGALFGCEERADSLFGAIAKEYESLKKQAQQLPEGLSILTERKTGSVWYVPGGQSTIGRLIKDAHAKYIFANDSHSGSLALSPEQILAKGNEVEVWAFKYFEPKPLTRPQLLQEYDGYKTLYAFMSGNIYECNTSVQPFFEVTSFHPEVLLREFILLTHPARNFKFRKYQKQILKLGGLRFYKEMNEPDDLPVAGRTVEC